MNSKASGKTIFANNKNQRIAILQPGYIPWLGFFEQLYSTDIFVFLDDAQFTKNDWRNRNRIKTKNGVQWLTIPVLHKFGQKISDTLIDNRSGWQRKHLQSFISWYGKSKYFENYYIEFERVLSKSWKYIVDVDIEITLLLNRLLGISSTIARSSELQLTSQDRQLRLIEICSKLQADFFYEGKSGQGYMDDDLFKSNGITVAFQDYQHPFYNQLWVRERGFISHLSIIDLLFNYGPDSMDIITGQKIIEKPEHIIITHADEV